MPVLQKRGKAIEPAKTIAFSFIIVILTGTILLMMPFSSKDGNFTDFIDALFTATSATCVTGLAVFDTFQKWSVFGQIVILLMIQIGGLGLVTFVTFFNFVIGKKLGLRRMQLASESVSGDGFQNSGKLIKNIIKISLFTELIGALVLMTVFIPKYGFRGIFKSIFISVSAFCNAGFDIMGDKTAFASLTEFNDNPAVLITVMILIISGGLGFIVWHDLINYKKTKHLELHTKLVIMVTGALILFGTLMFLFFEWDNQRTIAAMPFGDKLLNSVFQSVTCRTAGFNAIDTAGLTPISKAIAISLMFIGAAPGSTGGGIKITTFIVLLMTVVSVLRNKDETLILKRKIEKSTVYKSLTIIMLSFSVVFIATVISYYSISKVTAVNGMDVLFEVVSAFATVGLSAGVTAILTVFSKIVFIFLMFLGRVGPISVVLFIIINSTDKSKNQVVPEAKIMVG